MWETFGGSRVEGVGIFRGVGFEEFIIIDEGEDGFGVIFRKTRDAGEGAGAGVVERVLFGVMLAVGDNWVF